MNAIHFGIERKLASLRTLESQALCLYLKYLKKDRVSIVACRSCLTRSSGHGS